MALPKGFVKDQVLAAFQVADLVVDSGPHTGRGSQVLKPSIVVAHNWTKVTQDISKRESKLFRCVTSGRGPIFAIFAELVALAAVSSMRAWKAYTVAKQANYKLHGIPDTKQGLQDVVNSWGSNVDTFRDGIEQSTERLSRGRTSFRVPFVSNVAVSASGEAFHEL